MHTHTAYAISLACAGLALMLTPEAAISSKLEAAYVVLGGDGAIARAIVSDAAQCPAIIIDGIGAAMRLRAPAQPGGHFPVMVCEAPLPLGALFAAIEGRPLPRPKPADGIFAVLGDTGCRLKAFKPWPGMRDHDHHDTGQFQDCDRRSKWPFSELSKAVAARKPDLVIHVGDYVYRESPCPTGDPGCKGSPYGDNWQTWQTDFFTPAAPLLAAAPWIATRGNHEICERAGIGYFRFLNPSLTKSDAAPACSELTAPYTAMVAGRAFIVMDTSNASDGCGNGGCDTAPYAAQFAGLAPSPGSVLVSVARSGASAAISSSTNSFSERWRTGAAGCRRASISRSPATCFEILSFADGRSPQLIVGTGGTQLDRRITRRLRGTSIGGTVVSDGRALREFGFVLMSPRQAGWTASFITAAGQIRLTCNITSSRAQCAPAAAAR
jgi:Calcineurin-like phosphoesterase